MENFQKQIQPLERHWHIEFKTVLKLIWFPTTIRLNFWQNTLNGAVGSPLLVFSHSNTLTHTYIIHVLAKKKCQHVRKAANWRYEVMRVSFDFNSFHLTLLYIKYTCVTLHHAYITWVMSVCVCACVCTSIAYAILCSSVYGVHKCECDWHERETIEINHTEKKHQQQQSNEISK